MRERALTLDEKVTRKLENLHELDTDPENIQLVTKFIHQMIRDGKSRQSCLTYITSIRYVMRNTSLRFADATTEDIEDMLTILETWTTISGRNKGKPLSPHTKNTIKMQTKFFLKWLGKDGPAEIIHCKNLKGTKLPDDILTKDEVLEIIDTAGSTRDKAMYGLLYESGCRAGELLSMQVKHVEFLRSGGCAATFPTGKTGPRRVLIFSFAGYMRQWLDVHPLKDNPDAPLWTTHDSRHAPLTYLGLRYLTRELSNHTSIKKRIHPHGFRHSRATHLAEHLTEQQMKSYLGWTPGSDMASVYVHLSGKDIDNAIMAMNGIEDLEKPIDSMKPGQCPRCAEINPPQAIRCMKCGMFLEGELLEEEGKYDGLVSELISILASSEDGRNVLGKLNHT